jgi:predicted lipid-binding transport protein (Tim44 family)
MSKATANFTAADLKPLETAASKEAAQELLHAIVEKAAVSTSAIKPEKVAALHRNIDNARNKNEVVAIAWNMLLSGERLSSVVSKYQRKYA